MNCQNKNPCPCPNTACDNHGVCCNCVARHREAGNLPFCLRELAEHKK